MAEFISKGKLLQLDLKSAQTHCVLVLLAVRGGEQKGVGIARSGYSQLLLLRAANRRNSCLTDISPVIPKVLYISTPHSFAVSLLLLLLLLPRNPAYTCLLSHSLALSLSRSLFFSVCLRVSAVEAGSR